MWILILAEKTPEPLSEGSVKEEHIEDLLGLARPPRMLMNLMERHHRTAGGAEREEIRAKRWIVLCFLSIG
jgi:hypothetical protein